MAGFETARDAYNEQESRRLRSDKKITYPKENDEQVTQIKGFVTDALEKSGIGREGMKALIERDDELKARFIAVVNKMRVEENPYVREKIDQKYCYPEGWLIPGIDEQKKRLSKIFSGRCGYKDISLVRVDEMVAKATVPEQADGLVLIPKISYLGELGFKDPYGKEYGLIMDRVITMISQSRPFRNFCEGGLSFSRIRLHEQIRLLTKQLEADTPGDVLVMPVSLGNLYAGYSARNARWEALHSDQLPLGSAQVGCLLLMMPERLATYKNLGIYCSGDEYSTPSYKRATFDFDSSPKFYFYDYNGKGKDGKIIFYYNSTNRADDRFSSAVVFLSK